MNTKELISCDECCGCRLCEENCPQKAISMTQGELGLLFPQIDAVKCVDCHLCTRLCPQRKDLQQDTKAVFAAVNTRKSALLASASGGAFSAIARAVLNQDGIVYGAAMLQDEKDILKVRHIRVDSIEQLHLLQGSKYLQSDMSGIYSALKADMKEGKTVLFSGTPCQVAAVKSQCGEAEKLILAEIICHGIPSQTLFTDYLKILRGKGKRIEAFRFRTKESGWGLCASLTQKDARGKLTNRRIPSGISSYYNMFLRCETYRPSCYSCHYAVQQRVGDLTLGDYWGIEKDEAVFKKIKKLGFDITEGVSCVIASSQKGLELLRNSELALVDATFESVARENKQLTQPSPYPQTRKEIEAVYNGKGYRGLEERFNKSLGMRKYLIILRKKISPKLRMRIRMVLGK